MLADSFSSCPAPEQVCPFYSKEALPRLSTSALTWRIGRQCGRMSCLRRSRAAERETAPELRSGNIARTPIQKTRPAIAIPIAMQAATSPGNACLAVPSPAALPIYVNLGHGTRPATVSEDVVLCRGRDAIFDGKRWERTRFSPFRYLENSMYGSARGLMNGPAPGMRCRLLPGWRLGALTIQRHSAGAVYAS